MAFTSYFFLERVEQKKVVGLRSWTTITGRFVTHCGCALLFSFWMVWRVFQKLSVKECAGRLRLSPPRVPSEAKKCEFFKKTKEKEPNEMKNKRINEGINTCLANVADETTQY